jgi:hypothetical protein
VTAKVAMNSFTVSAALVALVQSSASSLISYGSPACTSWLLKNHPETFHANMKHISQFRYWKDLIEILAWELDNAADRGDLQYAHRIKKPEVEPLTLVLTTFKNSGCN